MAEESWSCQIPDIMLQDFLFNGCLRYEELCPDDVIHTLEYSPVIDITEAIFNGEDETSENGEDETSENGEDETSENGEDETSENVD